MDRGSCHSTGDRDQDHPQEKEMQKSKMAVGGVGHLQPAVKRREAQSKGENERYTHLNAEFQRIARRYNKTFNDQRNRGKQ